MYVAIRYFTDLQDNNHAYDVGDMFPRAGMEVTAERLSELSTSANKQGVPLIEEIKSEEGGNQDKTDIPENDQESAENIDAVAPKKRKSKKPASET